MKLKRWLCMLLVLCMVMVFIPVTASASSPETRITAIPPFPGGVEIAAMVRIMKPRI